MTERGDPTPFFNARQRHLGQSARWHKPGCSPIPHPIFLIHRKGTAPDPIQPTPDTPMSQVSITIDSAVLESFEQLFATLKAQVNPQSAPAAINEPQELAPFNAFLTVELTPYFGAKGATMIVEKLRRCRAIGDFRYLIPLYRITEGDLAKRQLLKTVSAVYRFKFGGARNPQQHSLRSEIKYAAACPECGALAKVLVTRLQAEGLWK